MDAGCSRFELNSQGVLRPEGENASTLIGARLRSFRTAVLLGFSRRPNSAEGKFGVIF